ncbi:putative photosystem I reaction center subunit psaK, chloroplastic [Iris pallida]|uniref:Photosystem I reaction center subunit psaK, chloroplastic n=1 Tax=Iris pallida TaxID=29817 RepID=A0AAX6HHW3_IRIPA|nr:putative photosystem I reaction center subunit psaK, chloroplastic [Iris pallida]KAJ6840161.1 putative photosystem I reaction center subunit psaK, chloroplastic [Iris pallida]
MASQLASASAVMTSLPHFSGLRAQSSSAASMASGSSRNQAAGAGGSRCTLRRLHRLFHKSHNGDHNKPDALCRTVRVGSIGKQEGDGRAEARGT